MKKEELEKLLSSPDFCNLEEGATGPYSIKMGRYRGRRDIYIREMFGNYFLHIDPMCSEAKTLKGLEKHDIDVSLYLSTKKNPEKGCLSVEEVYAYIDEYLCDLEIWLRKHLKSLEEAVNEKIPSLRP